MKGPSNSRVHVRANPPEYLLSTELPHFISNPSKATSNRNRINWLFAVSAVTVLTSVATVFYVLLKLSSYHKYFSEFGQFSTNVNSFAFGHGLLHGESSLWQHVAEANPSVWIWPGNVVYLDKSLTDCVEVLQNNSTECLCERNFVSHLYCTEMNPQNAAQVFQQHLLQNYLKCGVPLLRFLLGVCESWTPYLHRSLPIEEDYANFMRYMCPTQEAVGYPIQNLACDHPILGIYGHHDFPIHLRKPMGKSLFLDFLGEPANSRRRSFMHGIEQKYVFNEGNTLKEVSVFLLDDQYYADPVSCSVLRRFCKAVEEVKDSPMQKWSIWSNYCTNYLDTAPCCIADDLLWGKNGFCLERNAEVLPNFKELCDPTSDLFGKRLWNFHEQRNYIIPSENGISSFCEIFGITQRNWLYKNLSESKSRINIIVTSMPLFTESPPINNERELLFGDPWRFHRVAQQNILSLIGHSNASCVILLSAGRLKAEIKTFQPSFEETAPEKLLTVNLKTPLYQIISGGLTDDIIEIWRSQQYEAKPKNCKVENNCIFGETNFGLVDINWEKHTINLQIRHANDGTIAIKSVVNIHECTDRS